MRETPNGAMAVESWRGKFYDYHHSVTKSDVEYYDGTVCLSDGLIR
jgi:hypothetical protein